MKYLIAEKGMNWFKAEVEKYFGQAIPDCTEDDVHRFNNHMGWDEQGDGKLFYGWNVENGRLYDSEDRRWKSAIREICATLSPGIRLTAHQSILFTDIALKIAKRSKRLSRSTNCLSRKNSRKSAAGAWLAWRCQPVDWQWQKANGYCPV